MRIREVEAGDSVSGKGGELQKLKDENRLRHLWDSGFAVR